MDIKIWEIGLKKRQKMQIDNKLFIKNTNKEFLILGIHPLPLCPKSKTKKLIYHLE